MEVPDRSTWRFTRHATWRYARRAGITMEQAQEEMEGMRATAVLWGLSPDAVRFRAPNGCILAIKPDGSVVSAYWRGEKHGNRQVSTPTLDGRMRQLVMGHCTG